MDGNQNIDPFLIEGDPVDSDDDGFHSEFLSSERSSSSEKTDPSSCLGYLLENVASNHVFGNAEVLKATTICLKADAKYKEDVLRVLSVGLGKLIAHESASTTVLETVFYFFAKIAIKCHINDCDLPLSVLRQEIDGFSYSTLPFARARACLLMCKVFQVRLEELEGTENVDENLEQPSRDTCIPSSVTLQWAVTLCQRRLDKDVNVRIAALHALNMLPCKEFYDFNGNLQSSSKIVLQSLRDESAEVREVAIKYAPLTCESDIDMCLNYLIREETLSGRILMAERIAKNVHIDSYRSDQLIKFLKYLLKSDDSTVKCIAARLLIPNWLEQLSDDWDFEATFGKSLCRKKKLPAYPTALFDYFSILNDDEEVLNATMNVALSYYMECAVGNRTDGIAFIEFLRDVSDEYKERYRIHDRASIEAAIRRDEDDLLFDLYSSRCILQLLSTIYRNPAHIGPKDQAFARIIPNLHSLSSLLNSFVSQTKMSVKPHKKIFCVKQICILLRSIDISCEIGRKTWRDALYYICSDISFNAYPELVEFAIHEVLENIIRGIEDLEEFCSWICYSIFELLPAEEISSTDGQMDTDIDEILLYRVAIMLRSISHYASVEKMNPLMMNAFNKMTRLLVISTNIKLRIIGANLIGLAATLDDFAFIHHVHSLRHSLEIDVDEVKVEAMISLADVVVKRGFSAVAKAIYPEESQLESSHLIEKFKKLLEDVIQFSSDSHLPKLTEQTLRVMYCCCLRWPQLLGKILLQTFINSRKRNFDNEHILSVFFTTFLERGFVGGLQLIAGYMTSLDIIDSKNLVKFPVGTMTAFVCERLVPRQQPKNKKSSKDDDGEEREQVNHLLVLLFGILDKLVARPYGVSSLLLSQQGLNVVNLALIPVRYLQSLYNRTVIVAKMFATDHNCERRIVDGIQKLTKCIMKQLNLKGVDSVKTPRRGPRKSLSTSDNSDYQSQDQSQDNDSFDDFVQKSSTVKRHNRKRPRGTAVSAVKKMKINSDNDSFENDFDHYNIEEADEDIVYLETAKTKRKLTLSSVVCEVKPEPISSQESDSHSYKSVDVFSD